MTMPQRSRKPVQPGTYVVQKKDTQRDLQRLLVQNRLFTKVMGGPFAEYSQKAPQRVLDIGCGSGGWVVDVARQYPDISAVGVDISQRMITYAQEQAQLHQVDDRVEFLIMDVLQKLNFPDDFFDLIHFRLGLSFMRTWDWPKLLGETLRVMQPGGLLQIIDTDIIQISSSTALTQLTEMSLCAFFKAGHLFAQDTKGLTAHIPQLLHQYGYEQIQTKEYPITYNAGTPEGLLFVEDMTHVFHVIQPFFQKWGCAPKNYEEVYQRALAEMQDPNFYAIWNIVSTWGIKSTKL